PLFPRASEATAVTPSRRLISPPKTHRIRSDCARGWTAPFGRGPARRSNKISLPKPLRCFGLSLGELQVAIAGRRRLIPVLGTTTFCDTSFDIGPAAPVQEAVRHGCLQSLALSDQPGKTDRPVQAASV